MNDPTEEIPSLVQLTMTKLSIHLWSLQPKKTIYYLPHSCLTIQRDVDEDAAKLPIYSVSLKNDLINHARFMGYQILRWSYTLNRIFQHSFLYTLNYLNSQPDYNERYTRMISWTSTGRIDQLQTVLSMINVLPFEPSFRLACFFCLENDIISLWPQRRPYSTLQSPPYPIDHSDEPLLVFWFRIMRGKTTFDPYEGFKAAVIAQNEVAVRFFWEKMSNADKETVFDLSLQEPNNIVPLIFYGLNPDKREFLLDNYPSSVLRSFMRFGRPDLFIAEADKTHVAMLETKCFYDILANDIVLKAYYLFDNFWSMASDVQRSYTMSMLTGCHPDAPQVSIQNNNYTTNIVENLFKLGNTLGLKLILKHLDSNQREKVVKIHRRGRNICADLIHREKMELLKFYCEKFVTSKEAFVKLEKQLGSYFSRHDIYKWEVFKPTLLSLVSSKLEFRVTGQTRDKSVPEETVSG